MVEYYTALKSFFKLKTAYEKKYSSKKSKILNDSSLSKKEKFNKIKNIKMKCIHCKQNGGNVFVDKNMEYKALCGAETPCDFKIILSKPITYNLLDLKDDFNHNIKQDIFDILKTKLDLIFGFIDEETLDDKYMSLKDGYNGNLEQYNLINDNIEDQTNMIERTKNIKELNIELYENIQLLKNTMKEFEITRNSGLLKDCIEQYQDIYEKTELLRNNKYAEIFMEHEDDDPTKPMYLKTRINSIQDYELELREPEVVEFNV